MEDNRVHLTIERLAAQVAIPVRTVRYYISEGLLPGPEGRGKATSYSEEHLQRLRLIRLLSDQHRPLAEIYQLLRRLSFDEVCILVTEEEQHIQDLALSDQGMPQKYVASLLKKGASGNGLRSSVLSEPQKPAQVSSIHESLGVYEVVPTPAGEGWKRWALAPGIELHVRGEAEEQSRELLERIWKAAGLSL